MNTAATAASPSAAAPTTCAPAVGAALGLDVDAAAAALPLAEEAVVALAAALDEETPDTAPAEPMVVPLALIEPELVTAEAETPVLLTQSALYWAVVRGVEVNVMSAHCNTKSCQRRAIVLLLVVP